MRRCGAATTAFSRMHVEASAMTTMLHKSALLKASEP